MLNYSKLNEYKYILKEKATGKQSYAISWCYGNIYEQILLYKRNINKMCLLNVTNDTHEIIACIHLFNGDTIWREHYENSMV